MNCSSQRYVVQHLPFDCQPEESLQVSYGAMRFFLRPPSLELDLASTVTNCTKILLSHYAGWDREEDSTSGKYSFSISFGEDEPSDSHLHLQIREGEQGLDLDWRYRSDLFHEESIRRIHDHFSNAMRSLILNPETPLEDHQILGLDEQRLVTETWNETATKYPMRSSISDLFEEIAIQFETQIALVEGDRSWTYGELNKASNRLARRLRKTGLPERSLVGIQLNRSAELIIATLAVLKAGCGYVPLDMAYPAERQRFLIADTGLGVAISDSGCWTQALDGVRVLLLDREADAIAEEPGSNLGIAQDADDVAYVMYTSGSTGEAKGAVLPHGAIVRLVRNTNYMDFGPNEVFAQISNSSFDAITFEMWGALLNGAKLVILPQEVALSPQRFAGAIEAYGLSAMVLPTALFNMFVDRIPEPLSRVRNLIVGGDAVDAVAARNLVAIGGPGRLINGYGPTESATLAVTHWIQQVGPQERSVPIGRPIANTTVYILDAKLRPVPIGVTGQMYLGGAGLAKGYLNRPELTAERFRVLEIAGRKPERVYATGDLARFERNGLIRCLGRMDQQVKIRGFRVELGEVESTLRKFPGVADCLVIARSDGSGNKRLLGYAVPGAGQSLRPEDLKAHLSKNLPGFMVPNAVLVLDAFPVSPNGKIDRKALPEPILAVPTSSAGLTEAQRKVQQIWGRVLKISDPGIDANFFELGGTSIQLAEIETALVEQFQRPVSTMDLLRFTTIRTLSDWLLPEADVKPVSGIDSAKDRANKQQLAMSAMRKGRKV